MSERDSEPAPAHLQTAGAPAHSLEREAMRRRIASRLFAEPAEPVCIGRFRVQRSLGHGGMGVVYAAEDDKLGRLVALKVIRPDAAASRTRERQRLLDEARALARLAHPNVISIHEVGEHGDEIFIAMEYVRGGTLFQWMATPRTRAQILAQFVAAGRGLAAAHAAGLVHRDFKPSNVLVGEDGRARIVDFGLARGPRAQPDPQPSGSSQPEATPVSDVGGSVTEPQAGTPGYMAPEQALGRPCDVRSDQFSFCVALFEALYGRRPFSEDVVALAVRQGELRPPRSGVHGRVPSWLRRVLTRGLAFVPEARFASMDALLAALERGPWVWRSWAAGGAVGLALVAGFLMARVIGDIPDVCADPERSLLEVWGPQRRDEVRRAYVATRSAEAAEATWAELARQIDRYADDWALAGRELCDPHPARLTHGAQNIAARRICLAERYQDLADAIRSIERRDPRLARGAGELVELLPPISVCNEPAAHSELPALDIPRAALQEELRRMNMLRAIGHGEAVRPRISMLLSEARRLDDPRLEVELLLLRAAIEGSDRRDRAAAERSVMAAMEVAGRLGKSTTTAEALNEMAFLAAEVFEDEAQARGALASAKRIVGPVEEPVLQAALLETESYVERLAEQHGQVEALRRKALALRLRSQSASHPDIARSRMLVANAVADQGRYTEALGLLHGLMAEQRSLHAEATPVMLDIAQSLALVQLDLGEHAGAEATLTQARAAAAGLQGPRSARVATTDILLAQIVAERRPAEAITRLRGAMYVLATLYGPTYRERVYALQVLADLLLRTGQDQAALDANRELLRLHDQGAEIAIESVVVNIGDYLCLLGRWDEAVAVYGRLLAQHEPNSLPGAEALPLQGLGRVYLGKGEPQLALAFLERARDILIAAPRPTQHLLEQTTRNLAECLSQLKRTGRARVMLAEADRLRAELAAAAK